ITQGARSALQRVLTVLLTPMPYRSDTYAHEAHQKSEKLRRIAEVGLAAFTTDEGRDLLQHERRSSPPERTAGIVPPSSHASRMNRCQLI
ncbi:hypothetical protein, partial [Propionivibrio sp.]|uniref:hypothetical protein n=1 Tax=Propionivibrio sp. TaxID=2212460 RepID=UPI0025FBD796